MFLKYKLFLPPHTLLPSHKKKQTKNHFTLWNCPEEIFPRGQATFQNGQSWAQTGWRGRFSGDLGAGWAPTDSARGPRPSLVSHHPVPSVLLSGRLCLVPSFLPVSSSELVLPDAALLAILAQEPAWGMKDRVAENTQAPEVQGSPPVSAPLCSRFPEWNATWGYVAGDRGTLSLPGPVR